MVWPLIVGAALGLMKSKQEEAAHADDARLASTMTRFSPWTGMKGQLSTKDPNYFGNITKGAMAGYLGDQNQLKNLSTYESVLDENPSNSKRNQYTMGTGGTS